MLWNYCSFQFIYVYRLYGTGRYLINCWQTKLYKNSFLLFFAKEKIWKSVLYNERNPHPLRIHSFGLVNWLKYNAWPPSNWWALVCVITFVVRTPFVGFIDILLMAQVALCEAIIGALVRLIDVDILSVILEANSSLMVMTWAFLIAQVGLSALLITLFRM